MQGDYSGCDPGGSFAGGKGMSEPYELPKPDESVLTPAQIRSLRLFEAISITEKPPTLGPCAIKNQEVVDDLTAAIISTQKIVRRLNDFMLAKGIPLKEIAEHMMQGATLVNPSPKHRPMTAGEYSDLMLRLMEEAGLTTSKENWQDHNQPIARLYRKIMTRAINELNQRGMSPADIEALLSRGLGKIGPSPASPEEQGFNDIEEGGFAT